MDPDINPLRHVKEIKWLMLCTVFILCYIMKHSPIIIFANFVLDISFNLKIIHLMYEVNNCIIKN